VPGADDATTGPGGAGEPQRFGAQGRGRAGGGPDRGDRPWRSGPERTARPRWHAPADVEPLAPDEELVAGRRPVEEAFRAGRPARRLIVVPHRREALERIVLHATNLRIPIVEVEGGTLTSLAGFDGHQGVAVVVEPRRWASLEDVLARAIELGEPPFVLALDSLEDPHNVGTLLRSAEAAGVHGVIFPTHRQAPLSPSAVKASAGAVEHLLLCPVDDLAAALADLHIRGLRIAGAEADAPLTAREADLRGPLAIVVGSEGQGLGPAVRRRVDVTMRIPMRGTIDSLNAAVAGSILVFEALAQRDPSGTSRVRPPRQPLPTVPEPMAPSEPQPESEPDPAAVAASDSSETPDAAEPAEPPAPTEAPAPEVEGQAPPSRRRATRAARAPATEAPADAPPADDAPPRKRGASREKAGASEPATAPDADAEDDLLPGGPPPEPGE
jgi:23S rRNA (guanosine2251-2'-O)-methyltransferase